MPNADPKLLKSLSGKLTRLLDCVIAQASSDPEFAQRLADALSMKESHHSVEETPPPAKKAHFNPVAFLHENGDEKLRNELSRMTDNELREIVRDQGIAKSKEARTMKRDKLVDEIVSQSDRRLHQGSAFLR